MNRFSLDARPKASKTIRVGNNIRISVLTPCLIRLEKDHFTDLPTQTVWNRRFSEEEYTYHTDNGKLIVSTSETIFTVNLRSGEMERILLSDGTVVTSFDTGNLLGTARTLDNVNGSIPRHEGNGIPGVVHQPGI